jgi:hypothetical protein
VDGSNFRAIGVLDGADRAIGRYLDQIDLIPVPISVHVHRHFRSPAPFTVRDNRGHN